MRSFIWKECQENLKWVALPTIVIGGLIAMLGPPSLMNDGTLLIDGLVAGVFGAMLGFLQVFSESRGDKRSLLLHRPLSRSQIFLAKASVGVGLYLLALGVPFAGAVGLIATPGHTFEPFTWPMVLPWLADILTGLVYYFAGMLAAQREARWYGSRCLGLAAGLFCSILVWTLPEFWHALVAIFVVGGLAAGAAWGSFLAGGAYAPQPRLAKVTLAVTFLLGLSALSFTGKFFTGVFFWTKEAYFNYFDHQGRVLRVHEKHNQLESITDVDGQVPQGIHGERLDYYTLKEIMTPTAYGGWPKTRSYRNTNRALVKYGNETKPGNEEWWYVPDQGRLLGYDKQSKQMLGSFGPDGFLPPGEQSQKRFQGDLSYISRFYLSRTGPYLAFPGGVYTVNFRKRTVRTLYVPVAGETILWASRWVDEDKKLSAGFVGTDRSIHVLDEKGSRLVSLPLAYDGKTYQIVYLGRLEDPERYWVWYEPAWYRGLEAREMLPSYMLIYDRAGHETSPRQVVPPRPGLAREIIPRSPPPVQPSSTQAWLGLVTPPVEAAILVGTKTYLDSEVRKNNGSEVWLLHQFLLVTIACFIPGVRWLPGTHLGLIYGFSALMLVSALACALACFMLARRYAFSGAGRIGWTLVGFFFGWVGLLVMLAVQEWPARIPCPKCRKLRVVIRETCEHCGALHAEPAPDGTEIFEPAATAPDVALTVMK
jgi:hypothetical protein